MPTEVDAVLWVLALVLFVGGDWLTTRAGLAAADITESNPVAERAIDALGLPLGFALLKGLALAVGIAGYLYARAVEWSLAFVFPLVFVVAGSLVTLLNLRALSRARREG